MTTQHIAEILGYDFERIDLILASLLEMITDSETTKEDKENLAAAAEILLATITNQIEVKS